MQYPSVIDRKVAQMMENSTQPMLDYLKDEIYDNVIQHGDIQLTDWASFPNGIPTEGIWVPDYDTNGGKSFIRAEDNSAMSGTLPLRKSGSEGGQVVVATPVSGNDAANKAYVDQRISETLSNIDITPDTEISVVREDLVNQINQRTTQAINTSSEDAATKDAVVKSELQNEINLNYDELTSYTDEKSGEVAQNILDTIDSKLLGLENEVYDSIENVIDIVRQEFGDDITHSYTIFTEADSVLSTTLRQLITDTANSITLDARIDSTTKDDALKQQLTLDIAASLLEAKQDASNKDTLLSASVQASVGSTLDTRLAATLATARQDAIAKDAEQVQVFNSQIASSLAEAKADSLGKVSALRTELNNNISAGNQASVTLTGDQSIAGIKTFTAIPIIPTTTPSQAGQTASKSYVDSVANRVPTNTVRGGILRQPAMVDVIVGPTALNWNQLMAALRSAGIIATS